MSKKRGLDLAIVFVCVTIALIAVLYLEEETGQRWIILISGGVGILFLPFAILEKPFRDHSKTKRDGTAGKAGQIMEIVLLGEDDNELMVWDLYGKVALVIGIDVKENQVDIDLIQSPYASMVEKEHAVLNYSAGNWHVEDLGSANGIKIQKRQDRKTYQLSSETPCRLELGDIILVGLNRLLLR